jgi:hypothetical protein
MLQAYATVKKEEAKAAELQRREGLNEERSALHGTIESEFAEELALAKKGASFSEGNARKLKGFIEDVNTADGPGIIVNGRAWDLLEKHTNVSNVTLNCCHVPRQMASLLRLQLLTNLSSLTLKRCGIETIAQLLPLQYLTSLSKLSLPDNPVQTAPLLRPFLLWKMPNVGTLDGVKFSTQDIKQSTAIFEPLSRQISDFYRHVVYLLFCCRFETSTNNIWFRDYLGSSSVANVLLSSVYWPEQCSLLLPFEPGFGSVCHNPVIRTKPPSKPPSNWEKSSAAAAAGVTSAIQACSSAQ